MNGVFVELGLAGAAAALVAGATGSLHCALMCGPLACAGLPADPKARRRAMWAWQLGRVLAYACVGLALGWSGRQVAGQLAVSVQPALPWVMALGLVAVAFELGKHIAPLPGVAHLARAAVRLGSHVSPVGRSALMGAATPFLPCGLLYGIFLAAIAAGTGVGGALVMGGFALGGVPALMGAQAGVGARWGARWPRVAVALRRGVPLVAALTLIWRALNATSGAPPACH